MIGLFFATSLRANSVVTSVHNLSVSSPGTIKATAEGDVCIFCHTVHRANGQTPLWNHNMSGVTNYIVYSSPTLKAVVGQPNGSSRLCLSCHDGTVALGSVNSRTSTIQMQNGVTTMPTGRGNLGTDLSGDHPISFIYDAALVAQDPALNNPAQLTGKVKLDHDKQMQCTSCHDPHDDQFGNFLVMDNTASALCIACHNNPTWPTSAHAMSPKVLTANIASQLSATTPVKPTQTVSELACDSCHTPHRAASKQFLMRFDAPEQNCLVCHNGDLSSKNVAADFQKISVHPVTLNGKSHSPNEDPINPPTRHVTCTDCHNPHAASTLAANPPDVSGALTGVKGINEVGAVINPIVHEYEVCFRCHADSAARGPATVTRQFIQTNVRLQFSTANQSFHPVEEQGKNDTVPSLISPMLPQSLISCTDCHNSDTSPAAGGSGANGPHGSIFAPLLERNLSTQDFQAESPEQYALCYKCHDRMRILANQSFAFHSKHVVDDQTACTTCHDSHGVANAPHLINFNTTFVTPSLLNGQLQYNSTGFLHGNCSLTCHGKDHNATPY
ncbi:MAG TPA: cytochrome c3 family protein [Candidatus Baltobacteraceae bacterium]|nr:cytochrome c3 family protein [Candidatus Baltobacteraceae bacterium]